MWDEKMKKEQSEELQQGKSFLDFLKNGGHWSFRK